ncbi:hypothetical protein QTI66_31835 [Variovorax sp. J22R133]|uniref:hypothetical protein n=1 Tax=Variovorax brevis TaxID=3053503 RepID=UPI002575C0A9|nr:hypothetical protein [Variovorax sp. J22R133]MDM0116729.1 hypothetical protein [Variovorax sp. J22R133]
MSYEAALSILQLRSHLGSLGEARTLGNHAIIETAKSKLSSNPSENRGARVRIVQDGLARQLADIDAALLDDVLEAIGQDQMIKITHKLVNGTAEEYAPSTEAVDWS